MSNTTKPQAATPGEPPRPLSKPASVFADSETHLTVLCPRGVARVAAALQAIETLSGMLLARHEASQFEDDVPEVDVLDTRGILNAIAICATFSRDHLNGGGLTSAHSLALESHEAGFDQIQELTYEAQCLQRTKRDKRRLEILGGQSC